jgi:hypothetical protein
MYGLEYPAAGDLDVVADHELGREPGEKLQHGDAAEHGLHVGCQPALIDDHAVEPDGPANPRAVAKQTSKTVSLVNRVACARLFATSSVCSCCGDIVVALSNSCLRSVVNP